MHFVQSMEWSCGWISELLHPFANNLVALYFVGAVLATVFEYLVAAYASSVWRSMVGLS